VTFDLHSPPFTTGTLTTIPTSVDFNLLDQVAARSSTFRFGLVDGVTGEVKEDLTPIRNATLSHDTTRTIKRQLSLNLGVYDTERVNPLVDRVLVYMVTADGTEWPLGKYMFTDASLLVSTGGDLDNTVLNDEMFLVDQQISKGINGVNRSINATVSAVMNDFPFIKVIQEASFFEGTQAWTTGSGRGQILQDLALAGDMFSPWFDNNGAMRLIRSFDPALSVCDFNFDEGNSVIRAGIVETSDILTAPNRFIVISNSGDSVFGEVVGIADVPVTAPNSFANRGFYIVETNDLQVQNTSQAQAVANNLALRRTVFERVTITTAPDPRHDSYNVVQWQGEKWLELAWSMTLAEGAPMTHNLRKAYT
jgi:hypothetical protein